MESPNLYFEKNVFELKPNEIQTAIQKVPIYYVTKDFQIEALQYKCRKLRNNGFTFYYMDNKNRIQGELFGYYPNGNLAMVSQYTDNKLNGKVKMYYQNNSIKTVSNHINGYIHGENYYYSNNGNLLIYEQFQYSKLQGLSKRYCINGCCEAHLQYDNNLVKHIDHYIKNKLVNSYDLDMVQAIRFDSVERVKYNSITHFYEIKDTDLLELRCQ